MNRNDSFGRAKYKLLSMWPRIVVLLAMIGCCVPGIAYSRMVRDPVADYVAQADFAEQVREEPRARLYRAVLDLEGDGKKVVFLASRYARNAGFFWTVYTPDKHGYTVDSLSETEREMCCFTENNNSIGYIPEIKHRGIVFFHGRFIDGFDCFAFWISGSKARIRKLGTVKGLGEEGVDASNPLSRYFPKAGTEEPTPTFKMETLSLDDLRAKGFAIPKTGN
jgi:hypothetical protein